MFPAAPANNAYVEFITATAHAYCPTLYGMEMPRTLKVMIDCMPMTNTTSGATQIMLFGKKGVGWDFEYSSNQSSTNLTMAGFANATRNATSKAAATGWTFAQRSNASLIDNGSTLKGYKNGVLGATFGTWTAAQGSFPMTTDANPIYIGKDTAEYTRMRLYEACIEVNGIIVAHWRPKAGMTSDTIPDLSGFGNDLIVKIGAAATATLNTDFRYKSAWRKGVASLGRDSLG